MWHRKRSVQCHCRNRPQTTYWLTLIFCTTSWPIRWLALTVAAAMVPVLNPIRAFTSAARTWYSTRMLLVKANYKRIYRIRFILNLTSTTERFIVRDKQICVISSLASAETVAKNGVYDLEGAVVKNILYLPDETTLNRVSSRNGLYNFVSYVRVSLSFSANLNLLISDKRNRVFQLRGCLCIVQRLASFTPRFLYIHWHRQRRFSAMREFKKSYI